MLDWIEDKEERDEKEKKEEEEKENEEDFFDQLVENLLTLARVVIES